ncbi:MAG: imelysin family protein [Alphaproteobacteria bacterium]
MRKHMIALVVLVAGVPAALAAGPDKRAIVATYADIAQAMYQDAHAGGQALRKAVGALLAQPGEETMKAARAAWVAARVPYQQTEVFRFGNKIVDEWEGKVNAWPLDEGLIDYVDRSYGTQSDENPLYAANVIANPKIRFGGKTIDTTRITRKVLAEKLHEAGGVEANVAVGYHAIEFLLWGQDLNGTGPGAGNRPWTDYAEGAACTHGNCDRRARYLEVVTGMLVDDLGWMAKQWAPGGKARRNLAKGGPDAGIATILTGIGSLAYGELAGERMKLGLMLHDPEEEHDCFSDNTHNSHYYDVVGMHAVYFARYRRTDGGEVKGPAVAELVQATDAALAGEMRTKLEASEAALRRIKERAETKEAYDQMIGPDNAEGNAVIQAGIDALTSQTRTLERVVAALKLKPIKFEGSKSLDDPASVFKK